MEGKFVVYENWRAKKLARVHKASCGHARLDRIEPNWLMNNHDPNDRWFGYFSSLNEATAFGTLLPDRQLMICRVCLRNEGDSILQQEE